MNVLEKMEQLKAAEGKSIETMRLFFVGDLPAYKPTTVSKPPHQTRIFDQFAHKQMFKKMRNRNARSFRPLQTIDQDQPASSRVPSSVGAVSLELHCQSQSPSPCSSYLLKEKVKQAAVKAKLPNITYSRSVAEVLEMVGSNPAIKCFSPGLEEDIHLMQMTQSTTTNTNTKQTTKDKLVKLVDLVLPVIHQGLDIDRGEPKEPTLSTECPSPVKRNSSRNSSTTATARPESQEKAKNQERVKNIVEDIVKKVQSQNKTLKQLQKQNVRASVPRIDISLPEEFEKTQPQQPLLEETKQPPRKGYLIHDEICYNFYQSFRQNVYKLPSQLLKTKPPAISADQLCIMDTSTLSFVYKKTSECQIQIASLTKIVTALLTILICKKYSIDMQTYKCRVSDEAADMPGTSAELETGDVLAVADLLYGLLLPSGNDAAVCLAEGMGRLIQKNRKKPSTAPPARTFIRHMNILYKEMMEQQVPQDEQVANLADNASPEGNSCPASARCATPTQHLFQNPSGLSLNPNRTTAEQITLVSAIALMNPTFRQVVNTKQYEITFRNERYGLTRKLTWRNTNKLLWKDWEGVKTGTTETAGHCFIGKYGKYLVSVFDCATLNRRFQDATRVMEWVQKEIQADTGTPLASTSSGVGASTATAL